MGMGGKGGGGPSQISTTPDPEISAFAKEFREQSRGVREEVFRQVEEALRTGGIEAQIPIVQKSVEASKSATSNALQQITESLGRAGIAGTPFGERILAGTRLTGEMASANVGPSIAKEFINIAPNLAMGSAGTVISGLSSAADVGVRQGALGVQMNIAQMQQEAQILSALLGAGGAIGAGFAMCQIAAVLYGRGTYHFALAFYWINVGWRGRVAETARWAYHRWGRQVAAVAARSALVRQVLRPLFDRAVRRAEQEVS